MNVSINCTGLIIYFQHKNVNILLPIIFAYVLDALIETVLLSTHNICFALEIRFFSVTCLLLAFGKCSKRGSSTLYRNYIGFCPRTEFDKIL